LYGRYFPNGVASSAAVRYITDTLKTNKTVKELDFFSVLLADEDCTHLAHLLQHNNTIEWLGLSDCGVGDVGVQHLATALHNNTTLKWLNLAYNRISSSGWKSLVDSLENNTTLKYIYLGDDEKNTQLLEEAVGLNFLHCKLFPGTLTSTLLSQLLQVHHV
jgi:Ran GTPase-activating protein (RanGAP) involved in mRNA processing and transport